VIVLETDRLVLRRISTHDAEFILRLLNEPSFLRYIGDRGVRTLEDARGYIAKGPIDSYDRHGFGLLLVSRKDDGVPIGMCGLLKRDTLRDVDVGFAFLPEFWGYGYAFEAASAVLSHGKEVLGLGRIVAITSPDNDSSIRVLTKLGMRFEGMIQLTESEPAVRLFA
jgi:RimJ/RimL family protein N-acetyltransferase